MNWYPKACPACGGDLHDEIDDPRWSSCLMCARSYQTKDLITVQRMLRARPAAAAAPLAEAA
jgi:hypothetical protein